MTNQLSVDIGVVAGVVVGVIAEVVIGVVAGVVVGVGVELHLRLWKLNAVYNINLCLHLHAVLRCFCSPSVATPSDGALRRHPHTLTALRTETGIEDASGERGLCVWQEWGVRPLRRAIHME